MKIYNTLTRNTEDLIVNKKIYIYTCGPTLYAQPHIGNWRSFIFADILCSYLEYKKFEVFHVINLTDVDDKIIKKSQLAQKSLKEYTDEYKKLFFKDYEILKLRKAQIYPEATQYINKIVEIIEVLLKKKYAYKTLDGSVYFKIKSLKLYDNLFKMNLKNSTRVLLSTIYNDEYNKENYGDFALWKAYQEDDGEIYWNTSLGKGRPGWHIECSAMAMDCLPYPFDIHTGGIDNLFPHHVNELAQNMAFKGEDKGVSTRYWLHVEHLYYESEKISKSKNHDLSISFFLNQGFTVETIRFFLIRFHYKSKIILDSNFTNLKESEKILKNIYDFLSRFHEIKHETIELVKYQEALNKFLKQLKLDFHNAMEDNLNVSKAFASIFIWMNAIKRLIPIGNIFLAKNHFEQVKSFFFNIDKIFKLNFLYFIAKELWIHDFSLAKKILHAYSLEDKNEFEKRIEILEKYHALREASRNSKNYEQADELRKKIESLGYLIQDTPNGAIYKYKKQK